MGKKPKKKKKTKKPTGKKPSKGKKPTGKKPKTGKKSKKPRKVTFFVKRFRGIWKFKFPKISFKFIIKNKKITINKRPTKLRRSTNPRFPGWYTFVFRTIIYYIKLTTRGIKIVTLKGKKIITSKVVKKPKRKPAKKPKKPSGKKPGKGKKPSKGKTPSKGKKPKKEKKPKKPTGKKPSKGKKPKKEKNTKKPTGKKPSKGKKPTGKKPKTGKKSKTPRKVTFFVKRFPGIWKFKFPKISFKFTIKNKKITINKRPTKLRRSTNPRFPGWYTFVFRTIKYYIKFTTGGIKIVTLKGKKIITSKVVNKPKRKPAKKPKKP